MKRILLVAALALSACAAPSSYEGLAGGRRKTPQFQHRVPSLPSRFRSSRRAVLACAGTSATVRPLPHYANGSVGTTPSVVWEMVVRGPAAHGASDSPTRSLVDMNADRIPDLYIAGTADMSDPTLPPSAGPSVLAPPNAAKPTAPMIELYAGDKDGGFAMVDAVAFDAVRVDGSGAATVAPIGEPGVGVRLTTIWPGRPGKARWAAVAVDGSRVAVVRGVGASHHHRPRSGHHPGLRPRSSLNDLFLRGASGA